MILNKDTRLVSYEMDVTDRRGYWADRHGYRAAKAKADEGGKTACQDLGPFDR